ncbi:hypothetical protein SKAU_G00082920 [Synaphobranchus kaupii]|uniref:DIX domain-containing protein n=1 Tax=Synaphobranchus kaupii TaxID=118154 RepID=A0A9Q1FVP1_SYNKA|nr:hypothetical protein SKAU_G00082920 [Synaphobranchus kaupii]
MGAKHMKCLSSNSPTRSNRAEAVISQSEDKGECVDNQPRERLSTSCMGDEEKPHPHGQGAVPVRDWSVRRGTWEEQLCEQQEQLEKEMCEARKMLSSLQALLLHGSLPEDEQEAVSVGEGMENAEQQLVILRSHLDQSTEESQDLKKELLRSKQEMLSLQGTKDALQLRLSAQEESVLQLKQELLRSSMARDELAGHNEELQSKLEEMSTTLNEYNKEIGQKDRPLQQQALCTETENSSHELSESQNNGYPYTVGIMTPSPAPPSEMTEELPLIRDALRCLRNSFSGHDPQHHTIDTLEQGVANLMDRLHDLKPHPRRERKGRIRSPGQKANHTNRESWPPNIKVVRSLSSAALDSADSTKVLYFTARSLTPFLINIPKRLSEVTLRDFKVAVDREGSFRYHFKALDPEFGTVKEEVFQDEATVPGWEGKIVAWVEEDPGDSRSTCLLAKPYSPMGCFLGGIQ